MGKIRKTLMAAAIAAGTCMAPVAALQTCAQEMTNANGEVVSQDTSKPVKKGGGFFQIVFGSVIVGALLWMALFGDGVLAIYFCVDSYILVKPEKLMPPKLIDDVQKAMAEGDIVAAMEACQNTPSAMSNILAAAFQHVEEGFDVIQEAVNAASDLEQEKLMQRLTWISVCSNLGPSLGLLGTVQGMILTFDSLAAGGLIVSIPSITAFYSLRNNANRLILRMTAVTMEFLNGLRNVEVATGEEAPVEEV